MRLRLICVGQKMPDWVSAGYHDYARRMPPELPLELVEIPLAHRGKNPDIPRLMQRESEALLAASGPKDRVVALEVGGRPGPRKSWQVSLRTGNRMAAMSASSSVVLMAWRMPAVNVPISNGRCRP